MFELNSDGTRAIMPIDDMASICGNFYNASMTTENPANVNNGYNCSHPDCKDIQKGIGCCAAFNCPLGFEADEEDCEAFGVEYDELGYIITEEQEILDKLAE